MMRLALVFLVLLSRVALAEPIIEPPDNPIARIRELYDRGEYEQARKLLLDMYRLTPMPTLLFALGQCELKLGHYQQAIDYYERFKRSSPAPEQAALAEQAIGAARMALAQPAPPPPRERRWDVDDTGLVALGGASVALGVGLFVDAAHVANDRSGTLHDYAYRIDQAHTLRLAGLACLGAGALAVGAAVVRWRFHLVDVEVRAAPTSVSLVIRR